MIIVAEPKAHGIFTMCSIFSNVILTTVPQDKSWWRCEPEILHKSILLKENE